MFVNSGSQWGCWTVTVHVDKQSNASAVCLHVSVYDLQSQKELMGIVVGDANKKRRDAQDQVDEVNKKWHDAQNTCNDYKSKLEHAESTNATHAKVCLLLEAHCCSHLCAACVSLQCGMLLCGAQSQGRQATLNCQGPTHTCRVTITSRNSTLRANGALSLFGCAPIVTMQNLYQVAACTCEAYTMSVHPPVI